MFLDLNVFGIAGNEDTFHRSHQSTRTYKSIQLNAELGCLMCAKLWAWFKLETSLWDDFNLGLDKGHEHEVVFTMDFLRLETHRLCISLAAASDLPGEENWLALELLADPGLRPSSLRTVVSLIVL
jgi:hypothetical protein